MTEPTWLQFPPDFLWGAATAAYQIEGAPDADGKGPSIWDTFCALPGRIQNGDSGAVALDHYHRWPADLDLLRALRLPVYRFSVSWPRVFPQGDGPLNPRGLDFYDALVDGLLERGISPCLTLYHWDLPQALQDRGGWLAPATAAAFGEYAAALARRLGDRVPRWITLNEPLVSAMQGHYFGRHAPGMASPLAAFSAAQNLLLAHGQAAAALRAELPAAAEVGITLNLNPIHPASPAEADCAAAARLDLAFNHLFLDPLLTGGFSEGLQTLFGPLLPTWDAPTWDSVAAPLDFLGINYYSRTVVRHAGDVPLLEVAEVFPPGREYSGMWEIYPEGLFELLRDVWQTYAPAGRLRQILITENGVPVPDGLDFDGRVRDERRIRYLHAHLCQVHRAIATGVPVRGYFAWSLFDNFEWSYGYTQRFGLVYIDYATLARTPKDSALWFSEIVRQNRIPLASPFPGNPTLEASVD
jgi:beta-glucosidase